VTDLSDIADLIETLGKGEKRFFKMMASTESGDVALLVKLFDEVEKKEVSVEKLERSGYYSDHEVSNLYNLILKCLRHFHAESETILRFEDEILNLRCLIDKAQYRQCRKMLTSLKREFYETERFDFLLSTLEVEKKLIVYEEGKNGFLKPSIIAKEEQSIIDKKLRLLNLHRLYREINENKNANSDILEVYLFNPLLMRSLEALSRKECVFILRCKQDIFNRLGKMEEAIACEKRIKELFEKNAFLRDYFKELSITE